MGGGLSGNLGELKELKGDEAIYTIDSRKTETAKKYLFVVGERESLIIIKTKSTE